MKHEETDDILINSVQFSSTQFSLSFLSSQSADNKVGARFIWLCAKDDAIESILWTLIK